MGHLEQGVWTADRADSRAKDGRFKRNLSQFRDRITADGSSGYKAEPGRYHLYISHACPWAHRTVIYRKLKRLDGAIGLSVVHWYMGDNGWEFAEGPGCVPDSVNGARYLYEIYRKARSDYTGRITVPVLWDKETGAIVNNESSEIIRMFDSEFRGVGDGDLDFYPEALRDEIDEVNARTYEGINNGVYRTGFASTQEAYEEAFDQLFETLDWVEERLSRQRYLCGARLTEADVRVFPTLLRFDPVYVGHFKCNLRRIADYPNLWNYLLELYQMPGVAETCDLDHIKRHYYASHTSINPTRFVPKGPAIDFTAPHDRDRF